MTENSSSELMAMTLIANSGDARSLAFQALVRRLRLEILMKQIDYLKNRMRSPKSPIMPRRNSSFPKQMAIILN